MTKGIVVQATTHAENVRETYRRQGEQRLIQMLLLRIDTNPGMTTDYIKHLLESLTRYR